MLPIKVLNFVLAQNFSPFGGRAVKFCFTRGKMLKFFHEDFDLQEVFPPLAGVRGWILGNFVLIHPPPPASGGENPCKPPNFVQKINALKFAKKNLTALPLEGVRGRENAPRYTDYQRFKRIKFGDFL